MLNQVYCNNCEKYGHSFHSCRKPFISSGVIAFRQDDKGDIKYLMVCRKHTYGFIDFMRGKYAINNKSHIQDILFEMTDLEKKSILTYSFEELWLKLWGSKENTYYKNEKIFAKEKFNMLVNGITVKDDFYNTKILIESSNSSWKTPEWGFPKGRKNQNESNILCAIREWCEESGFKKNNINILENIVPFDEFIIGSNYQSYRDMYYIGQFTGENYNNINYQKIEISDAKWVSIDEAKDIIRPYHKERLEIILKISEILQKWKIIK